ncbi:hypothetical protein D3C76_01000 [compost metagenome]
MNKITEAKQTGVLTEMESTVMNWLMEYGYYAEYSFSDVDVKDISRATDIDIKSAKGVVGSLVKKGYLTVSDREGEIPPIVYATKKGYQLSDEYETRWQPQEY